MYIYKTSNLINNTEYVGQHVGDINDTYIGSGLLLIRAIKKYGKENFQKEIIEQCKDIEELNEKEIFYIEKYDTLYPNGYNLRKGGNNSLLSESTKKKISESRKGKCMGSNNPNWKAASFSKETIKKISESIKKRYQEYPEYRESISKTSKNRKHTKQTKNSISKKNKGKLNGRYIHFPEQTIKSIINDYLLELSIDKVSIKYQISPYLIKRILTESSIL